MKGLTRSNNRSSYSKLIVVIVLGGPILDLLTGYFMHFLNIQTVTPGILFRGGIILPIIFLLSVKNRSATILILYGGILLILSSIAYNLLAYNQIEVFSSINRFLKIVYPFLGFGALVYIHNKKSYVDKKWIWKLGYYCGLITVIGVVVFTLIGFRITTYTHQAYTSSGIFGAANDTGLVILLSYCFFLFYNQKYQSKPFLKLSLITPIYLATAVLISTRALYIGIPTAFFLILGFGLLSRERKMSVIDKVTAASFAIIFVIAGIYIIDFLVRNEILYAIDRVQELASGRFEGRGRVTNGISMIFEYNFFEHLFGAGEARFALVENDIVDIYGKFGILFLIMVMGTSLFFLMRIYKLFFTSRNLATLSLSIALSFYIFHGAVAGHAFTSAQVNNLIMIVYFLIYLYAREQNLHRKLNQLIKRQPHLLNA